MLKKAITYYDFDGNEVTEDIYFNLTQTELIDMEATQDGGFQNMLERISKSEDPKQILRMFETILKKSYGIRSADGRRFIKSEQISEEFTQTAAYDAFFTLLITETDEAVNFVNAVMPKALVERAQKENGGKSISEIARERSKEALQDFNKKQEPAASNTITSVPELPTVAASEENTPQPLQQVTPPASAEIDFGSLSREQLEERLRQQAQQ